MLHLLLNGIVSTTSFDVSVPLGKAALDSLSAASLGAPGQLMMVAGVQTLQAGRLDAMDGCMKSVAGW